MSSEPTSLAGYVDEAALSLDGIGAVVDYLLEHIPEVRHPWSNVTFAAMSHEPQLSSILRVYLLAMSRATWTVNGEGCDPKVTAQIADDLGLPVKGTDPKPTGARRRRFSWAKHLRIAGSLSLKYGHAPFAQSWVEQDGMWRLDMVQERMPQTIVDLQLNSDGTLKTAEQGETGMAAASKSIPITTADHRLVWYDREREGSNYYGVSLLRASYGPWLIKDQMLRVLATSHRKHGMGTWTVTAPAGAAPGQVTEAQRIAGGMKAGESNGIGVPAGFIAELKGMTGTLPDTLAFITYLDRLMTRSTLTSILDMATAEKGNRSLGETIMDLMILAQQTEADRIADDATAQIVVPLVDGNWGENEPAPRIECGDVGADVETTAQDIYWLTAYAGLKPDAPARAWIRQLRGIPPEDPNDPIFQQPVPAPPAVDPPEPPDDPEGQP